MERAIVGARRNVQLRWWRGAVRRTLFFGLTFLTSIGASALLFDVLQANGLSGVELLGLTLFFGLFTWIAGALWTAIAGFFVRLAGRDPDRPGHWHVRVRR